MSDEVFANISQYNFGEKLVELIFNKIIQSPNLNIHCYEISKDNKEWFRKEFNVSSEILNFSIDEQLHTEKFTMNGMSRVDVFALNLNQDGGIGIEVKLGKTGGAKKFPKSFIEFWKKSDSLDVSSKGRISGNMIQILDSKRSLNSGEEVQFFIINENKNIKVDKKWWLVLRKDSLLNNGELPEKVNNDLKIKFNNLERIFVFEELWSSLIVDKEKIISELVSNMVSQFFKIDNSKSLIKKEKLVECIINSISEIQQD